MSSFVASSPSSSLSSSSMSSSKSLSSPERDSQSTNEWFVTLSTIKSYVGSILQFKLLDDNETQVEGKLTQYNTNSHSLLLSDATQNGVYCGCLTVFDTEVKLWRINTFIAPTNNNRKVFASNCSSKIVIPVDESDEEMDDHFSAELESIDLNDDQDLVEFNVKHLRLKTSDEIRVYRDSNQIDSINNAIKCIESSNCCGFALFGDTNHITRQDSVKLIAFSTEEAIFAFDAKPEIALRLKSVLESETVEKVVHSCRHMSDTLYRLYDIKLTNVCDIRINDYFLQQKNNRIINSVGKNYGLKRAELRSLEQCLDIYLAIRLPLLQNNTNFNEMSNRVKNQLRFRTLFLREMSIIINFELMKELSLSTERCLKSLRSANDIEYQALKEDECELQLIECPLNPSEEDVEKKIFGLSCLPISGLMNINGLNHIHTNGHK